ncbi:uncharacterized protein BT62DRAFT_1012714 [Guyanagaster necrorhizus]|uniref:Uncharacterized protein n=1 Tax=Guyanagaster necrorhizus TaxID=856835 RepID=A0A9P8AM49_9AGAR|nr:uncharacterized protein BT62DRAFT_1012714 [Guyanagaster necrorhizus MCA 3950]KAG7440359.1 hypothetical protein BT62DRAFT_1012714 [Guyanagaster necrorhizus MCA 3950]
MYTQAELVSREESTRNAEPALPSYHHCRVRIGVYAQALRCYIQSPEKFRLRNRYRHMGSSVQQRALEDISDLVDTRFVLPSSHCIEKQPLARTDRGKVDGVFNPLFLEVVLYMSATHRKLLLLWYSFCLAGVCVDVALDGDPPSAPLP